MTDYMYPDLSGKVSGLEGRIDTAAKEFRTVKEDVTGLRTSVGELSKTFENKIKELGKTLGKTDNRLNSVSESVARLRHDLDHLQSQVAYGNGVPKADLDTWDFTAEMISSVRSGLRDIASSQLELRRLSNEESKAGAEVVRWDKALNDAIKAARGIRHLKPGQERAWRRVAGRWRALCEEGPRPADKAAQARALLAAADLEHQSLSAAAEQARQTDVLVCATIRERVEQAVGKFHVLPPWLSTALGRFPPREADQIGPWLDAVTALIRYRLLADVRSPMDPFGAPPHDKDLDTERTKVKALCSAAAVTP